MARYGLQLFGPSRATAMMRNDSPALLRLISLNAGQQFFFQPGPALLELLNFRLVASFRLITLKKVDDVAVLVTKRVEAFIRRH